MNIGSLNDHIYMIYISVCYMIYNKLYISSASEPMIICTNDHIYDMYIWSLVYMIIGSLALIKALQKESLDNQRHGNMARPDTPFSPLCFTWLQNSLSFTDVIPGLCSWITKWWKGGRGMLWSNHIATTLHLFYFPSLFKGCSR